MPRGRQSRGRTVVATPWFSLKEEAVVWPGRKAPTHFTLHRPNGVIVIATAADGRFVAVQQYRPALRRLTWEFPCGMIDKRESPAAAALRELEEETGFVGRRAYLAGACHIGADRIRALDTVVFIPGVVRGTKLGEFRTRLLTMVQLRQWTIQGRFRQFAALGALLNLAWRRPMSARPEVRALIQSLN